MCVRRKDIGAILDSIEYVEGQITEFPESLRNEIRSHLRAGGKINFVTQWWSPAKGSLGTRGQDAARFERPTGEILTVAGRFAIPKDDKKYQIIVIMLPYAKPVSRIIIPKGSPRQEDYNGQSNHTAWTWHMWFPNIAKYSARKSRPSDIVLQVTYPPTTPLTPTSFSSADSQAKPLPNKRVTLPKGHKSLSRPPEKLWSPSTSDESEDETRRPSPIPKYWFIDGKGSHQANRSISQTYIGATQIRNLPQPPESPYTASMKDIVGDDEDEAEEEDEEEDDDQEGRRIETRRDLIGASLNPMDHQASITPHADRRVHATTLKFVAHKDAFRHMVSRATIVNKEMRTREASGRSDRVEPSSLSLQDSVIKIEDGEADDVDFSNVKFVFKDFKNNEQGRSSFTSCDSATALFDEALAAGIGLTTDTRMLTIRIDSLAETHVRVDKRTVIGFDDKILIPLRTLLLKRGDSAKIEVCVKHYY